MLDFDPNDEDVIWSRRVRGFNSDDPRPHRQEKVINIRSARLRAGITRKQLADLCGVSVDAVKNWELRNTVPHERYMDKLTWVKLQSIRNPCKAFTTDWDPELIKVLRSDLGMSQTALGSLMGVTRATVARWEAGTTTPSHKVRNIIYKLLED